ncbi:DNA polymerase zeta catalytic subunit, partial [Diplocarpon rosae]
MSSPLRFLRSQKVCAHIHGAFPYLYVEYAGSLNEDDGKYSLETKIPSCKTNRSRVGAYIHRLHLSIDYALAVSYRRNMFDGNAKFVARITLAKGVPFYGFHVGYRFYLKIYMLNPMVMTRLSDLLRQGIIMKKVFQPYEAHLQFLLQWMVDYNLYGCGYINCRKVTFRAPVPEFEEIHNMSHLWHDRSIPPELVTDESVLPRVSHCSLEVDICVQDILNRQEIKPRFLHHDFIERLNPLAPDEKLVHSMAGLWKDETRRRKSQMTNPAPGSSPFPAEVMISMSADPRSSQPGGWIHEQEYRDKVMSLIVDERNNSDGAKVSFASYVRPAPFESSVKTSMEAVEDLYPENLRSALGLEFGTKDEAFNHDMDDENGRDVDERRIGKIMTEDDQDYPYDSDEEVMREMELSQRKTGDKMEEKQLQLIENQRPEHQIDDESRPGGDMYDDEDLEPVDLIMEEPKSSLDSHTGRIDLTPDAPVAVQSRSHSLLGQSAESHKRLEPHSDHENLHEYHSKRQKVFSENNLEYNKSLDPSSGLVALQKLSPKPPYRNKWEPAFPGSSESQNLSSETNLEQSTAGPGPRGTKSSGILKLSQESCKATDASQSLYFNFPVVKDPNDPNTILRLSQKSASQITQSKEAKNVSFDPSLPNGDLVVSEEASKDSSVTNDTSRDYAPAAAILGSMINKYGMPAGARSLILNTLPPSLSQVTSAFQAINLPAVIYQDAFYSNELDVPERAREWAGREFRLESLTVPFLPDFDPCGTLGAIISEKVSALPDKVREERNYQRQRQNCSLRSWVIANPPPTSSEVIEWSREDALRQSEMTAMNTESRPAINLVAHTRLSQVDGPTQKNKHGFKYTQDQQTTSVKHETQYMSTMSLEIHINTRGSFVPNPEEDEVQCLFWCLQSDEVDLVSNGSVDGTHLGAVVLSEDSIMTQKIARQVSIDVQEESTELDLMIRMVDIVRNYDPDILTGYEVHGGSWGYLIERARLKYDYNLCDEFSRMKTQSHGRFGKDRDKWGFNNTSTIRVTGRHMINIWRAMRSELNLLQYTIENVTFHLLHRRIPHFTWADLTRWYTNGKTRDLAKTINHYVTRVQLDLELLEQNELIPRTSEQARLLGVDFFSVISRGSQFKVESLMFRVAKPENFMLVSPSRKQVGGQNALECLPLVMEPQSAFYNSPLLVLDFQSLYPSVMIAYNYCYSTFLGRIVNWRGTNKMGFAEYRGQQRLLELLKDHINIAPNGIMYTRPEIRKSLLAKMLGEILETRVMVKSGMKVDKDDKALQRLLNNRQLALKLIANVTYGYTSASFSGRMPCSEIADSIVQTGRETLERAIALIHSVKRWGAEVVYGDTDSIFVYLKGRTKDQAFDIGEEIAKTVTNMNPRPIKLKFEKVYLPCVLLAKKRYVGFKYEHRNQAEPEFDAKGIETVRRDGTPAEQKIEEKALKILFRTSDLSQVKSYFQQECEKIMKGSVSVQDFCFAREVRLGTYSGKGPPPPGALISTKRMLEDARAEPQYGERVPYVVITGAPGARLIDRCVAPEELLENEHSELDAEYYILKNLIPPLERIFNLVGANVRTWYDEMPKVQRIRRVDANLPPKGLSKELAINKKILESYMKSSSCLVCREKLESDGSICPKCLSEKPTSLLALRNRLNSAERKLMDIQKICQGCSGISPLDEVRCDSKDCPVFYTRTKQTARLKTERSVVEPVMKELAGSMIDMADLDCMGLLSFLFVYLLGGLTFIPLAILAVISHAYFTFPIYADAADPEHDANSIIQAGDDVDAIRRAQKTLGPKFQPRDSHEAEVAAGYFAVSRTYVPGGVGALPPERTTPTGSTTVSAPSPSVYQTMYRSIFDRKPVNSPIDNKGVGKPQKRGTNVFYVVLRHGHLMLFDDDEQLEVRHVVSLAHHEVSIYSGGDETPEGELFIRRNALCLSRRTDVGEITPDGKASKPFFLFSENCSEKEDFYFALLRNQERRPDAMYNPPVPLQYDVKDVITLVQRLHSSEEHLQTRWVNAVIGRIFLALYKTPEVENFVRAKITKKISRVKTPAFLSKISLRQVDMGEAAPVITNPRLKDLTVDGELVVEADVKYSGNFRIEVAATARIDLGSRFKAREVNLLLAVVLKRIEGHALIRIKPPPSNRLWMTFQTMPKIDMTIEPIVSSRQITYTIILRQIENRIKEVVAESLVFPNWDDSPFSNSEGKPWRGGIWADEKATEHPVDHQTSAAREGDVDEMQHLDADHNESIMALPPVEKSISSPLIDPSPPSTVYARKNAKSALNLTNSKPNSSSSSIDTRASGSEKPRAFRSDSFVSASTPIVSTSATHADAIKSSTPPEHSHAMAAMTALSQANSPTQTPVGSPSLLSRTEKTSSYSSVSSQNSTQSDSEKDHLSDLTPKLSMNVSEIPDHADTCFPPSPESKSNASLKSEELSANSFGSFGRDPRRENSTSSSSKSSSSTETKVLSLAAVSNAAATAKKWGWNAFQRNGKSRTDSSSEETPSRPLVMGRGQPLPPPGVPLPRPDKKTKTAPIPVPKRRPVPPPDLPSNPTSSSTNLHSFPGQKHAVPPPLLPRRRSPEFGSSTSDVPSDELLVVQAPAVDSEPTTPVTENAPVYMQPWVDDEEETNEGEFLQRTPQAMQNKTPPRLPKRRPPHRVLSSSLEEDGHKLPSWMAAQEEEARARSTFVHEDAGL